uniref:Uncharacterized protein n=1 Tax=Myoviridae sp. ctIty1 TaxID=2827673 RepID=A0A8S5TGH4_9CAUD|nr:MAG TPA: hypothetical protein [Myoviridae sp. ctIty1]
MDIINCKSIIFQLYTIVVIIVYRKLRAYILLSKKL